MELKIKRYILLLYREGTEWENRSISQQDNQNKKRGWFSRKRVLFIVLAAIFSYFLKKGFNEYFIGYVISALAIFIGLFISVIITLYQKTISDDKNFSDLTKLGEVKPNDNLEINRRKTKIFIRQFTFVTGKNFLIAILLIITTAFMLLFKEFFSIDVNEFKIAKDFQGEYVLNFIQYAAISGSRIVSLYLFFDFFFLLLYSLGALFAFLKGEYGND